MASLGKNRALITGISGFTGQHLANTLAKTGWEIVGLGNERLPVESDHQPHATVLPSGRCA